MQLRQVTGLLAMLPAVANAQAASPDSAGNSTSLSQLLFQLTSWVQSEQQWYNEHMTGAIEKLAGGGAWNAGLLLASLSFVYGVFHAVGPGHGKTVVASYVLANERTLKRGVLISFMAGFFQAVSAIAIVTVMGLIFNMRSRQMDVFGNNLETLSYALITLLGLWLLFGLVRGLLRTRPAAKHDHQHDDHGHDHAHDHAGHDHHGHAHLPGAAELEGGWSWTKAVSMAAAVGVRPCTGALIVLVVAMHQNLYWAGVVSTFLMALGTSITVSLLAVMAVKSRDFATQLAGSSEIWVGRVETLAKVAGGLVMTLFGFAFFLASLHPHPFQ